MGTCFTKTTTATTVPPPQQFDVKSEVQQPQNTKNDQPPFKKEIFVIKHRISHETDRHTDKDEINSLNPSATAGDGESRSTGGGRVTTSTCSKDVDAILIQCGRLSRSNSAGAQNPSRKRRYSRSKRSFDFDLNTQLNNEYDVNDNDDGELNLRHRQPEARVSSPSSRRSSRERDPRLHRSSSKERRISISPSRRSESPFRNLNTAAVAVAAGGSSSGSIRPAKMVSVPATDKSNNVGVEQAVISSVKRIHVKRNIGSPRARSPAKTNLRIFNDNPSHEEQTDTREDEDDRLRYRRKSLAEIDNNAARSLNTKPAILVPTSVEKLMLRQNVRTRRLSRDLDNDNKPERERILDPSPPSYASLLLEDIHNFHQKNTNATMTAPPPAFSLPACVTKACSIMDAVADLNSNTSSYSEDRKRNPTPISEKVVNDELERTIHSYVTVRQGVSVTTDEQESSGSNSVTGSKGTNSTEPVTRTQERDVSQFKEYPRELLEYPRKGIGRYGRRSTVGLT